MKIKKCKKPIKISVHNTFLTLCNRHSTMIVGQTGSGKSTVWKILQSALSQMKRSGEAGYNIVKVI